MTDKARWEEDNEVQEAEKQEAEMIQGGCTAKYKHTYTLAQYWRPPVVTSHSENQQPRSNQDCCTIFLWEKQGSSYIATILLGSS